MHAPVVWHAWLPHFFLGQGGSFTNKKTELLSVTNVSHSQSSDTHVSV